MHFYRKGNYLIVYGGKNLIGEKDCDPVTGKMLIKNSEFVEQISLLRLDTLTWYEVAYQKGNKKLPGLPKLFNFSSEIINDRILIFGGMHGPKYK